MFIFRTLFWGSVFIIIALVAGPWVALNFDTSFPEITLGPIHYAGAAIGIAGVLFAIYSAIVLVLTGPSVSAPYEAGGAFSISGPYRYMRNPLMLGIVITLWGEALYFERLSLLLYAFLFSWAAHAWVVFVEEPALRRVLKRTYTEYHKAVPRWLPRLKGY